MLVQEVIRQVEEIIDDNKCLVTRIVARRMRCENWLHIEIYKRMLELGLDVQIEHSYPEVKERCYGLTAMIVSRSGLN
jgi:hypothetical protein